MAIVEWSDDFKIGEPEIDREHLSEQEIGFEIGPRLNALGRLGDANVAVEFLTTQEEAHYRLLQNTLEFLTQNETWWDGDEYPFFIG